MKRFVKNLKYERYNDYTMIVHIPCNLLSVDL